MRLLAVGILTLFLAGCILPSAPLPRPEACGDPSAATADPFPPLYVQTGEGIDKFEHRTGDAGYDQVATRATQGTPYGIKVRSGDVFAAWDRAVVRYDADLDILATREGDFGGLDIHDGHVWIAGKGSLGAYDEDLEPISTRAFDAGTYKVSHDVLICAPYALLLDNVVSPIFVYQVDITDPEAPRTLDEDGFDCMCHLAAQWIDAENEKWYVLEDGGGRGHHAQNLHTYPLGGGKRTSVTTFEMEFDPNDGSYPTHGTDWAILAVSPSDPPLAVGWKDGKSWFGELHVGPGGLALTQPIDLHIDRRPSAYFVDLAVQGPVAAVLYQGQLRLVSLDDGLSLTHEQDLGTEGRAAIAIGT